MLSVYIHIDVHSCMNPTTIRVVNELYLKVITLVFHNPNIYPI